MGAILEIKYFNSFWTKKLETGSGINSGTFPGPVEFGDTVSGLGNNNLNETVPSGDDNFWEYGGNVIKQSISPHVLTPLRYDPATINNSLESTLLISCCNIFFKIPSPMLSKHYPHLT